MLPRIVRTVQRLVCVLLFFFQAEDGIRDPLVTGVQTCALPISSGPPGWPDLPEGCGAPAPGSAPRSAPRSDISAPACRTPGSPGAWRRRDRWRRWRSEERRVGKECRWRWRPDDLKKEERELKSR